MNEQVKALPEGEPLSGSVDFDLDGKKIKQSCRALEQDYTPAELNTAFTNLTNLEMEHHPDIIVYFDPAVKNIMLFGATLPSHVNASVRTANNQSAAPQPFEFPVKAWEVSILTTGSPSYQESLGTYLKPEQAHQKSFDVFRAKIKDGWKVAAIQGPGGQQMMWLLLRSRPDLSQAYLACMVSEIAVRDHTGMGKVTMSYFRKFIDELDNFAAAMKADGVKDHAGIEQATIMSYSSKLAEELKSTCLKERWSMES